jgi:hypothetical protein
MPRDRRAAGHAKSPWRSGRLSGARTAESDATDALYGVTKPDVIGDFLRERALEGLFGEGDRDEGDRDQGDRQGQRGVAEEPPS